MLKKVFLPPTAESKILRYGVNRAILNKVYELPFQIKNDIKVSMFQYKLIHNILPTKVSLFKAKISDIYVIYRPGGPYREKLCPQGTVFPYTDRPRQVNNIFIFFPTFASLQINLERLSERA